MRSLLTFAGSILYAVVMTVISPLIILVYGAIELVTFSRLIQKHLAAIHLPTLRISYSLMPVKKYANLVWARAMRFHL